MTLEEFRERFTYNWESGMLVSKYARRRHHHYNRNQVLLGCKTKPDHEGYIRHMLSINGVVKPYPHWVWYYHHGWWPKQVYMRDPNKGPQIDNLVNKRKDLK